MLNNKFYQEAMEFNSECQKLHNETGNWDCEDCKEQSLKEDEKNLEDFSFKSTTKFVHREIYGSQNLINELIMNLPENKTKIPKWIGCPPNAEVEKVKYMAISKMAYYEWEAASRPEGRDLEFWNLGEKYFNNAFVYWI
jgi:hypothetical protein